MENTKDSAALKRVTLLGSTGSIGQQALEVIDRLGGRVTALTAHRDVDGLETQIRRYRPALAVLADETAAADLRVRVRDLPVRVAAGPEAVCEAAAVPADVVLNAVVGVAGLLPTLAAIAAGHTVALANKETLVAGGALVTQRARAAGVDILPVDSEHSAIFQCLQGQPPNRAVKRLLLTASGGPFYGWSAEALEQVTLEQALRHPNWSMGPKITIDSATLMNKGLEVIEARWLFDVPVEHIDVVVHRESIVHSLVEFDDNAVLAQLGTPDMRLPIQFALTYPQRYPSPAPALNLCQAGTLTFAPPDEETFVCLAACRQALTRGGLYPAAVNAANEQAVSLFRQGRIGFGDIGRLVSRVLEEPQTGDELCVEAILQADRAAREVTQAAAEQRMR